MGRAVRARLGILQRPRGNLGCTSHQTVYGALPVARWRPAGPSRQYGEGYLLHTTYKRNRRFARSGLCSYSNGDVGPRRKASREVRHTEASYSFSTAVELEKSAHTLHALYSRKRGATDQLGRLCTWLNSRGWTSIRRAFSTSQSQDGCDRITQLGAKRPFAVRIAAFVSRSFLRDLRSTCASGRLTSATTLPTKARMSSKARLCD